ncbi:MAG TPA: alanine--tRNA ligase-related protein, partial [Candidatus Polarisedimenticolia bacterium]|nr:alanine--tRNA ligase-related protein [Candidatus Polarisedimenticolia bacterium]
EMEKHREAARTSWKGGKAPSLPVDLLALPRAAGWKGSEFRGYETLSIPDARIVALAREQGQVESIAEGERGFLVLDRTPFYAESGGQIGDTGQIKTPDGSLAEVEDTQAPSPGLIVHFVTVLNGSIQKGSLVEAVVNPHTRAATMRNHTATHLLHAALKKVLGPQVQQAGSYVGPDRLRFDFNYPAHLTREALDRVEDEVNEQILRNITVTKTEKPYDEALSGGAIALFGEKYGDRVRVVAVPGYSQELCGGTHCAGTGDIGYLKLVSERGIAAGVRRIEALTGMAAVLRSRSDARILAGVEELLKAQRDDVQETLVNVLATQKAQSRELEKLKLKVAQLEMRGASPGQSAASTDEVDGVRLVVRRVAGLDRPGLRMLADNLKREAGTAVVILASEAEGKVSVLAAVSADLADRLDARVLIKDLAAVVGGGGGGNATLAEAGGKSPEKIPELLDRAKQIVAHHLTAEPKR